MNSKQRIKAVARKKTTNPIQDAANLIAAALETLGFDLEEENFDGTPERFVRYLLEYKKPYDTSKVLKVDFTSTHIDNGYKGVLVQSGIPFRTICPHHLLPVLGVCHIGYIPSTRVVGLSKLTRIVEAVGHELPRMQETCTDLIADALEEHLGAKGVMVVIKADHSCMTGRGVKVHQTPTSTSTVRGLFRDVAAAREEFFELVRMGARSN
jgi:GTP cyclohydrolase I